MKLYLVLFSLFIASDLTAQFSGGGLPFPRRSKDKSASKPQPPAVEKVSGRLQAIDNAELKLVTGDARTVTAKLSGRTKFYAKDGSESKPENFRPGAQVRIEATQDKEGYYQATALYLESEPAAPPTDADVDVSHSVQHLPPLARTTEDIEEDHAGPPRIKRGRPEPRAAVTAPPPPMARPAKNSGLAAALSEEDAQLQKTREAVDAYTASLPNFFCQEQIARFASSTRPADWRAIDIVSTALVYENGKEDYRDITINGKPAKKSMQEIGGSWSTGEFGTLMSDLFSPSTAADFRLVRYTTVGPRRARVYSFEVEQSHSHWNIQTTGQSFMPAYKGSVWIDEKTSQVVRIEMQGWKIPKEFPLDTVEAALDYAYTRIGDAEFLVPVHAEILTCTRGTSECSRNVIDFRNYHKYSGQSKITF